MNKDELLKKSSEVLVELYHHSSVAKKLIDELRLEHWTEEELEEHEIQELIENLEMYTYL